VTNSELTAALVGFTENQETGFLASIPLFIKQTEQRVFNTVMFPALRKNVSGSLSSGNKYLACPDDFLSVSELAVVDADGAYSYLLPKDVSFMREVYPSPTDTGLPRYYALFGPKSDDEKELTFILGPTPDSSYSAELHYFFYPASITEATDGRSWLGDNFDSVLLYGALVESCIYMKGEADLLAAYEAKFQEALAMAKRLGNGLERGDAFRDGTPKAQVT
jgi:hypothetical protein